jgi:hypothetical protein
MRSKHAVWMLGLVLLASALPGAAMASSTRVQSLGLQGDYIMDYSNVQMYPSAIVRYQNLVYGDLGVKDATDGVNDLSEFVDNNASFLSEEDRAMGAILGNLFGGKMGSLGIFLNENASPISQALGAQYFDRNHNEAWNVVWGYKFSQLALGLKFDRTYSSVDVTFEDTLGGTAKPYDALFSGLGLYAPGNNGRQIFNELALELGSLPFNTMGFGGGVTMDFEMDGRPSFLDLSGEVRRYQLSVVGKDSDPEGDVEDNGGLSFAFNARAHLATSEDFQVVPVVNFYTIDMSLKETILDATSALVDTTSKIKTTGFNLGLAGQWKLRESDWLTLGLAYQSVKLDGVDTPFDALVKYTTMPNVFGALESNLWPWLTLRLGASKPAFSKLKLEHQAPTYVLLDGLPAFPEGTTEIKDSPFQYSVGLGFHLGHVDLDAVLNQDFAFTGGALAGNDNSEIPFTRLTATYRW